MTTDFIFLLSHLTNNKQKENIMQLFVKRIDGTLWSVL